LRCEQPNLFAPSSMASSRAALVLLAAFAVSLSVGEQSVFNGERSSNYWCYESMGDMTEEACNAAPEGAGVRFSCFGMPYMAANFGSPEIGAPMKEYKQEVPALPDYYPSYITTVPVVNDVRQLGPLLAVQTQENEPGEKPHGFTRCFTSSELEDSYPGMTAFAVGCANSEGCDVPDVTPPDGVGCNDGSRTGYILGWPTWEECRIAFECPDPISCSTAITGDNVLKYWLHKTCEEDPLWPGKWRKYYGCGTHAYLDFGFIVYMIRNGYYPGQPDWRKWYPQFDYGNRSAPEIWNGDPRMGGLSDRSRIAVGMAGFGAFMIVTIMFAVIIMANMKAKMTKK